MGTNGLLGTAAAGFLFGRQGAEVTSVVAFDTASAATRASARVQAQTASDAGDSPNLVFAVSAADSLRRLAFVNRLSERDPVSAVSVPMPTGTTGALVDFDSGNGHVTAVIPYAANRSASGGAPEPSEEGGALVYRGSFPAVFDGEGKNLAPQGARTVRLDRKTGAVLGVE